jgi:hypothetical protein
MVGAILLVSALIFGALAGGVVVQRLHSTPVASSEQDRSDEAGDKNDANTKDDAKAKDKHPNNGHHDTQEPDESEDKDA